jgi:hypothetical protein
MPVADVRRAFWGDTELLISAAVLRIVSTVYVARRGSGSSVAWGEDRRVGTLSASCRLVRVAL